MRRPGSADASRPWPATRTALLAAGAVAAGSAAAAWHSRHVAPYEPELVRVDVDGGLVRRGSRPISAAFITDMHVGPAVRGSDVERAMRLLPASSLDLLLLGGDYLCESPRFIPEVVAVLRCFAEIATHGAFAVLGNHDCSNDAPRLRRELERAGIRVLTNEAVSPSPALPSLCIAGIDDAILGQPDLDAAFSGVPEGAAVLALWHEPDWARRTAARGACLQLSGHSHGGQVRLPGLGPVAAPAGGRRYVAGSHLIDGMTLYVSRGVGVFRPPVRFWCPPEVTLLSVH